MPVIVPAVRRSVFPFGRISRSVMPMTPLLYIAVVKSPAVIVTVAESLSRASSRQVSGVIIGR